MKHLEKKSTLVGNTITNIKGNVSDLPLNSICHPCSHKSLIWFPLSELILEESKLWITFIIKIFIDKLWFLIKLCLWSRLQMIQLHVVVLWMKELWSGELNDPFSWSGWIIIQLLLNVIYTRACITFILNNENGLKKFQNQGEYLGHLQCEQAFNPWLQSLTIIICFTSELSKLVMCSSHFMALALNGKSMRFPCNFKHFKVFCTWKL